MIEVVIFAIKARQIGGQGVDKILPVARRSALFEIVDIGVETTQFERAHDF
ncbi:hypothetical protein D3C87_2074050 [compost metagenome]